MTTIDQAAPMTDLPAPAAEPPGSEAVRRAVHTVPGWAGRRFTATPVFGGLQNSNWRVRVDGEDREYFVKLPGAGTETFIDRGNAHAAGVRAAQAGISPRIVSFQPETGVEIVEFLEGYRACTNGDMKSQEIARSVIGLFRTFHTVGPLPVTKTVFDMIDEHLEQVRDLGVVLPSTAPALLREAQAAQAALQASGLDLVPCHNDPMPGNFLTSPAGPMKLIDFEFSSNNERAYDLALVLAEFFYDEARSMACIEEFYGAASWDVVSRVRVCVALADVKWGLWGCVNQKLNDSWDFDYHKYGTWKLARARAVMADPRWPQWLAAL
ncbi:MAG TPA: choline/ethanolamine kinase family protein [Geodermatophilus sp.]|nr:choline/ethanolamine kinase family protein [Geodermatophilus sp.]